MRTMYFLLTWKTEFKKITLFVSSVSSNSLFVIVVDIFRLMCHLLI